jgi:hypothetical protein
MPHEFIIYIHHHHIWDMMMKEKVGIESSMTCSRSSSINSYNDDDNDERRITHLGLDKSENPCNAFVSVFKRLLQMTKESIFRILATQRVLYNSFDLC